jgi:hypothetical protein
MTTVEPMPMPGSPRESGCSSSGRTLAEGVPGLRELFGWLRQGFDWS